jgi:hypothetical protein
MGDSITKQNRPARNLTGRKGFEVMLCNSPCLHRVLIEAGTLATALIKTVGTYWNEMLPFRISVL